MKKRLLFVCIVIALASFFSIFGCTVKKSSNSEGGSETVSQSGSECDETQENGTQEKVNYKSLIEKYVGKAGTEYKAHTYMLKKSASSRYSAEEWIDSDGGLRLPFVPDDIKQTVTSATFGEYKALDELSGLECFYVPDELVAEVSTAELADVFMSYGYNSGIILALAPRPESADFEREFEYDLSHCNALEESLRRNDFAAEYLKIYMAESFPEYYEGMEAENFGLYSSGANKTCTLNMLEVLLAQPEACEQLTDGQRLMLVKRVIEKEKLGEQGKLFYSDGGYGYRSFFFACITGELYLSGEMAYVPDIKGEIERQNNPWLAAIKEMDLTDEERKVTDKYIGENK